MPSNNSRSRREQRRKDAEWRAENPNWLEREERIARHLGHGRKEAQPLTETLLSGKRTPKGAARRYGAD